MEKRGVETARKDGERFGGGGNGGEDGRQCPGKSRELCFI